MKNNEMKKLLQSLAIDELSETHRDIADVIGKEQAYDLFFTYGGQNLYIPKTDKAYRTAREKKIYAGFLEGEKAVELARMFGISAAQVYEIIKNCRSAARKSRKDRKG
jgi:Mor family transcriptional regulator